MNFNFDNPNNLSDAELVRLVQCRDEEAFTELVSRYSPRIWNIVVNNSRQRRDAEEILMDIWLAVWQNIIGLRKVESFGNWLRKIAHTACNRYYASKMNRQGEIIMSYEDLAIQIDREAEERFQNARIRAEAREAVHHLPQKVRAIAEMYYLDLTSIKEIAEEFDLPIGTVKSKLSEVRRLLRKEFEIIPTKGNAMSLKQQNSEIVRTKCKIVGVGGAGCNAVKQMFARNSTGIEFYAVDTDKSLLDACHGLTQIHIGKNVTQGRGTDGSLNLGKKAAAESIDILRDAVSDADMVFIVAGMGGGTGTTVAPLIASLAKQQNALAISIVTRPFGTEGEHRIQQAEYGVNELQSGPLPRSDAVIVVPNQQIFKEDETELSIQEAYKESNEILCIGIEAISALVMKTAEINIDLSDFQNMLTDQGRVLFGIGKGNGEDRARIAAQNAITSPLLEDHNIVGDVVMIVSISAPPSFTISELGQVLDVIMDVHKRGKPMLGLTFKHGSEQNDEVIVSLMANGEDPPRTKSHPKTETETGTSPGKGDVITNTSSDAEFVHLHNHSEYSLLDSACRIPDMIQWAIENSSPAIALTDHGNMFGAWEFYNTARNAGVNPIVGCEVNVVNENMNTNVNDHSDLYHLTLLAENAEGYHNLIELSSLGYTEGFRKKPCINLEILKENHAGIIALTGCINGLIPKLISARNREKAVQNLQELKDIMGEDNLFVEIQNHYLDKELAAYPVMVELAKEFNLPVVGTNDCHYMRKEDHRIHDILLCIQSKKTINDLNRVRFNNHFYFKNVEEMQQALIDYPPELIFNTVEIANRCNLRLDYNKNVTPYFEVPDQYTQDSYLRELCYKGLRKKLGGHLSEPIQKQVDYELHVIEQSGHANYFLIIWDYLNYANKQGYLFMIRGSAASSLVLYALNIITFNPMDHGCYFERFLNLDKMNLPDINIDLPEHARDDVIDYLVRKYGHDSVGRIATFATFGTKGALKDVGRALEIPLDDIQRLTDLIPPISGVTIDNAIEQVNEFHALAEKQEFKELIAVSKALFGIKRHVSVHNSAIVLSNGPLSKCAPLFKDKHGKMATQFDGKTIEDVGIIRLDNLGVRSLSMVSGCLTMIQENHKHDIALQDIPLDDKLTYSLISNGLLAGLFQLGLSTGMHKVVNDLKPDKFEHLAAIIALYRPGPIQNGDMQKYIERKNGLKPSVFPHPMLENALNDTYGICLFQEQLMQIVCEIAGFTRCEADILREAMGKNRIDMVQNQLPKFVAGALENGIEQRDAEEIYEHLNYYARHAFNKSHTISYALLSYRMAYLKSHYPHEFMAAMMLGDAHDSSRLSQYTTECVKLADFLDVEINILPIDINISDRDFVVRDNDIQTGLIVIEQITDEAIDSILTERNRHGFFTSFKDFAERANSTLVNEQIVDCLIKNGAFNALS